MNLILSDRDLDINLINSEVVIKKISINKLKDFENDSNVKVIVGSRAMAIKVSKMNFPCLRLFQLTSAGFDNVPISSFTEKNILIATAGTVYSAPIAETVIYGILCFAKRINKNPNFRIPKIQRHYNLITELYKKKVLILGAGSIGTEIAKRLDGFEMEIYGYDLFCKEKKEYKEIIRNKKILLEKLHDFDFIISTLPDNDDTKEFINKEFLEKLNKNCVVINVGRISAFNQHDFYDYLRRKCIKGAVLDMFELLPNCFTNKFRRLSNVIVLPGVSAISQEVNHRLKYHIIENINTLFEENKKLSYVINEV